MDLPNAPSPVKDDSENSNDHPTARTTFPKIRVRLEMLPCLLEMKVFLNGSKYF